MIDAIRDYIGALSRAYRLTFGDITGEGAQSYVLEDLSKFCFANETTANDPYKEGRRQVWLRLQEQLRLTPEQLMSLNEQRLLKRYGGGT